MVRKIPAGTDISSWVQLDSAGKVSFTLADIAAYRTSGAAKAIPGFDVIDYGQEDYVFGSETADARHWDEHVLDVFDEIDVRYTEEEAEKLKNKIMSELVFEQLDHMPREGDRFCFLNAEITVLSMKKSRIYRLKVRKLSPVEDGKGGRQG